MRRHLVLALASLGLLLTWLCWPLPDTRPDYIRVLGGERRDDLSTDRITTYDLPHGLRAQVSAPVHVQRAFAADAAGTLQDSGATTCVGNDTTLGGTVDWTNPTYAQGGNNTPSPTVYTSVTLNNTQQSRTLKCTGFGFALDAGSTIAGIKIDVLGWASHTNRIFDQHSRLVIGGTIQSTNVLYGSGTAWWPTVETPIGHGGETELWGSGAALNPTSINASDFGYALATRSTANSRTAYVDYLRITVFYYPPKGVIWATGFETSEAEIDNGIKGAPAWTTGIHGGRALLINTVANTPEALGAPTSFIDADIVSRAWATWTIQPTSATLAIGQTATIAWWDQQDSTCVSAGNPTARCTGAGTMIGCSAKLTRNPNGTDGQPRFSVGVYYEGREAVAQHYGSVTLPTTSTTSLALNQFNALVGPDLQVNCQLAVNGALQINHYTITNTTCSSLLNECDMKSVWLGTPRSTDPALTLIYDSFAVGNDGNLGVLRVETMHPTADGGVMDWGPGGTGSNCPASSAGDDWECLNDWATPGATADAFIGTGGATSYKGRIADLTGTDEFVMGPLTGASAPTAGERILGIVYYAVGGNVNDVNSTQIYPLLRRGTPTARPAVFPTWPVAVSTPSPRAAHYVWPDDLWQVATPTGTIVPAPTWGPTPLANIRLGYVKPSGAGAPRITALLAYVALSRAAIEPDRTLQDWSGDGDVTVALGCDSISTGTASLYCQGGQIVGNTYTCTQPCTTDADCPWVDTKGRPATCQAGSCLQLCETSDDCTCGSGAGVCQYASSIAAQTAARVPQVTNLYVVGQDGIGFDWYAQTWPEVIDNPYGAATRMGVHTNALWKGEWGKCAVSSAPCAPVYTPTPEATVTPPGATPTPWTNPDCPGGVTDQCIPHGVDYFWNMCGWNDVGVYGSIGDCAPDFTIYQTGGLPANCPRAATTPGTWQAPRVACTQTGGGYGRSTTCDALYTTTFPSSDQNGTGPLSRCYSFCLGATDPVRPCWYDSQCTYPVGDPNGTCGAGMCSTPIPTPPTPGAVAVYRCTTDDDCPTGWTPCNNPDPDCVTNHCARTWPTPTVAGGAPTPTPANMYCTVPCEGIACDADEDCWQGDNGTPGPGWCARRCNSYPTVTPTPTQTPHTPTPTPVGATYTPTRTYTPTPVQWCVMDADCNPATPIPPTVPGGNTATPIATLTPIAGLCPATGACANCSGGANYFPWLEMQKVHPAQWRQYRLHDLASTYKRAPDRMMENHEVFRAQAEDTAKRRYFAVSYTHLHYVFRIWLWPVWQYVRGIGTPWYLEAQDYYIRTLRRWEHHIIDLGRYFQVQSDRNDGWDATLMSADLLHLSPAGSLTAAEATGAAWENLYPVCAADQTVACGACVVHCTTDADCRGPTGEGATPTPVSGSCNASGLCTCANDAQCGGSNRCRTVSLRTGAAPTPTALPLCVPPGLLPATGYCPTGDQTVARKIVATDSVCSGACQQEISPPRCVEAPATRCIDDADCPTGICSVDASYITCDLNAECRSNSRWTDVCAHSQNATLTPWPTGVPTRTPTSTPTGVWSTSTPTATIEQKVCRQPTRTP